MALKKCRKCGAQVSSSAQNCPNCGSKNPIRRVPVIVRLLFGIVALIVVGRISSELGKSSTVSATANLKSTASTSPRATAPVEEQLSRWRYSSRQDEMTSGKIREATVDSTNQLEFKFPYSGAQNATLELRQHPRFGKDVIVSIERGQFICSVTGCSVLVRFDDGPSMRFNATGPSDYSSTALFISPYNKFYSNLIKAKQVRVSANFYQEGNQTLRFTVTGLDPVSLK